MINVSKYIIYGLIDPRSGHLKYIGLSSNGLERPKRHFSPSVLKKWGHLKVYRWISGLIAEGLLPTIEVIVECSDRESLMEEEKFYISYLKFVGARLLNLTEGGEAFSTGKIPWNTGKKMSKEARLKMSLAKKGKKQSPEAIANRAIKLRGKKRSPQVLAKRLATNKQRIAIADQFGNQYQSISQASKALKIWHGDITSVLNGEKPSHRGFIFKKI